VIIDRSITDRVFDEIPIFIIRLVEDSGGNTTGGAAHLGIVGVTIAMRSSTICRARSRSVPRLNSNLTDDSWETDLERRTSRLGNPASACSIGTVTRRSTSTALSPRQIV